MDHTIHGYPYIIEGMSFSNNQEIDIINRFSKKYSKEFIDNSLIKKNIKHQNVTLILNFAIIKKRYSIYFTVREDPDLSWTVDSELPPPTKRIKTEPQWDSFFD